MTDLEHYARHVRELLLALKAFERSRCAADRETLNRCEHKVDVLTYQIEKGFIAAQPENGGKSWAS